jgi:hypothetical protein
MRPGGQPGIAPNWLQHLIHGESSPSWRSLRGPGRLNDADPDAPVRTIAFAELVVTHLILDDQQIVDVLDVQSIDLSQGSVD